MKNRLEEALALRFKKQADLCKVTGLSRSSVSHYAKQTYQPTAEPLHKMAKYLNVSEMWLAGYDVPMQREDDYNRADDVARITRLLTYNDMLLKLVKNAEKLDEKQLTVVNNLVNQLKDL